jgi:Zn-dependent protease with chaperone function
VLAYAIAAVVHLTSAALLLGGAAVAGVGFPKPLLLLVGGVMIAAGVLMRPRAGGVPEGEPVERAEAPALWQLVDDVAAALDTPPPDRIVVEPEFNAHWSRAGIRRTRVLGLGLPLLAVLSPRERVAVVAHELAHARNGDIARSWFIGSAVGALAELGSLLTPAGGTPHHETALLEVVSGMLLRVLRLPVDGLLAAEAHLLMHDSRRAEYLADALAADVAGTDAAVALQVIMLLDAVAEQPARRRAVTGSRDAGGLLAEMRAAVVAVPERERERRRRVAARGDTPTRHPSPDRAADRAARAAAAPSAADQARPGGLRGDRRPAGAAGPRRGAGGARPLRGHALRGLSIPRGSRTHVEPLKSRAGRAMNGTWSTRPSPSASSASARSASPQRTPRARSWPAS